MLANHHDLDHQMAFWKEVRALQDRTETPFISEIVLHFQPIPKLAFTNELPVNIKEEVAAIYEKLYK